MFASSALFTLYHTVRFVRDLQQHLKVGDPHPIPSCCKTSASHLLAVQTSF